MTKSCFTKDKIQHVKILKPLLISSLLGFTLFFTSCFSMETDFTVKEDGSSKVRMIYLLDEDFISFWEGTEKSGYLLFPISKRDFEQRVNSVNGAGLVSYKTSSKKTDEKKIRKIDVKLEFKTPEALNNFFNGDYIIEAGEGKGSLKCTLFNPSKEISPEAMARVIDLAGEGEIILKVNAPSEISSVPDIGTGKSVIYQTNVSGLLIGSSASNIQLNW